MKSKKLINIKDYGIGFNSIKSKLQDFRKYIDKILVSSVNPGNDSFMFTFMLYDKKAPFCNNVPGYKWIFLDPMFKYIDSIKEKLNRNNISENELRDFFSFHYIGNFNADKNECGGACWRIAKKGTYARMIYNLEEPFSDYVKKWKDNSIYNDNVITSVQSIEKILWSPPNNSKNSTSLNEFWIFQKEISRVEKDDELLFSLQILARIPTSIFKMGYPILSTLFDNWKDKFLQLFDEVIYLRKIYKQRLKTAIISILIDSYAHNISAHSLAALKWWFDNREAEYDKRINIGDFTQQPIIKNLINLEPAQIEKSDLEKFAKISDEYYKMLGLNDSSNDVRYTSLMETIRFMDEKKEKRLLTYEGRNNKKTVKYFRYPVPIDFAISKFLRFLRDKAAFWSGVTRDLPSGGETKNLYDILWNDFANNPLYLGTIAHSEGINKLKISIELLNKENNYEKLEFAIIDMSVIKYEADLNKFNQENSDHSAIEYSENTKIKYSKYALIYIGKDHEPIRNKLQKSYYNVFLPGGVVGEHALFTIFENTIRNIKHFAITNEMKKEGLNLNIRITPSKLMKDGVPELGTDEHKLFKIGVYLDHENRLFNIKMVNNKTELIRVKEVLENQTSKPVVDENGAPRLGGNTQDKICAAMLLNNQFISVETNIKQEITERDKYYCDADRNLYWMGFEDTCDAKTVVSLENQFNDLKEKCRSELESRKDAAIENLLKEYNIKIEKDTKKNKRIDTIFEQYFYLHYKDKINQDLNNYKGRLLKYFHLWKGDFIYPITKVEDLKNENISRFKFVFVNEDNIPEKLETELKNQGVVRILTLNDFCSIKDNYNAYINKLKSNKINNIIIEQIANDINNLKNKIKKKKLLNYREKYFIYMAWLKKFIDNEKIGFYICVQKTQRNSQTPNVSIHNYQFVNNNDVNKKIYFHHSGETHGVSEDIILDYRSHGWMREKIFSNDNFSFRIINDNNTSRHPVFEEFIEVLSTKICVIDNRINGRIAENKKDKYKKLLNLEVYREFDIKNEKTDQDKWYSIVTNIANKKYNFFIIHLSYIESLGYSENQITDFFDNELNFKKDIPEKFFVIITTGRGRSKWIDCLDKKYKGMTIFKPIESILNAVEHAVSLKDDIQLKYNLCKIIYGS